MENNTTMRRLGELIIPLSEKNLSMETTDLRGVNFQKYFMPSVANTIGVDLSSYKIIRKGQFACNLMHVGRDKCLPIALHDEDNPIIVSPAYFAFKVKDESVILSEYLFLIFKSKAFDEEACFYTDADVRQGLIKSAFFDIEISVPPIEEQRAVVARHKAIEHKIDVNRRLIAALEETARTIYRHTIVDNIDPENLPQGWEMGNLGDYIISYSKSHSFNKSALIFLNTSDIYDGEILISEYSDIYGLPGQAKKSIAKGDILYSEIRPANKRNAIVRMDGDDYVVSTKLMVLRRKNNDLSVYRLYNYLTLPETLNDLQGLADGDSGTFPQITFEGHLEQRQLVIADKKTEDAFQYQLDKIYNLIFNLKDEISHLKKLL